MVSRRRGEFPSDAIPGGVSRSLPALRAWELLPRRERSLSAQASMCCCRKDQASHRRTSDTDGVQVGGSLCHWSDRGPVSKPLTSCWSKNAGGGAFFFACSSSHAPSPPLPPSAMYCPQHGGQLVHSMGVQHAAPSRCCFRLALWRNLSPVGQFGLARSFLYPPLRHALRAANMGFGRSSSWLTVVRIGIREVLLKQICVGAWCHEAKLSGNSLPAACFAGSPRSRSPF